MSLIIDDFKEIASRCTESGLYMTFVCGSVSGAVSAVWLLAEMA